MAFSIISTNRFLALWLDFPGATLTDTLIYLLQSLVPYDPLHLAATNTQTATRT
jgi:hypothetical protein